MDDEVVLAKAKAAREWCQHATAHANGQGGKPWSYVLMPHEAVDAAATLEGLEAQFSHTTGR
jgi:type III restriction enzyme